MQVHDLHKSLTYARPGCVFPTHTAHSTKSQGGMPKSCEQNRLPQSGTQCLRTTLWYAAARKLALSCGSCFSLLFNSRSRERPERHKKETQLCCFTDLSWWRFCVGDSRPLWPTSRLSGNQRPTRSAQALCHHEGVPPALSPPPVLRLHFAVWGLSPN